MGLLLATLAAVAPPAANSSNHDAVITAVNVGLAIVLVALLIAGKIIKDRIKYRRIHEGESVSKRKRVLRSGVAANAKVLSSLRLKEETDLDDTHYYSIVFEVLTHGDASFRAKGVEEMPAYVRLGDGCELQAGDMVAVKYDPVDDAVFLVDPYQKYGEVSRRLDEAKRQRETEYQEKERAAEEKEARLLRGDRS